MKKIILMLLLLMLPVTASSAEKESTFDRVVRTGELRCGYNYWEPGFVYDDQKKTLWGYYYDLMKAFEEESGIKVVWDHVVDWGQVREELEAGRIDAMCAMWNTTAESRYFLFTKPFAYQTVEAIVRVNDTRFDQDLSIANAEGITIAVVDNATQDFIAKSDFPKAKRNASTMLASNAELMMDVQSGKSDMTFTNPGIFNGFVKANGNKLKRAALGKPLRVYGNSLTLKLEDKDLANLLNVSFSHLIDTGKVDTLIDKYNKDYPDTFMKPVKSFVGAH